MRVGDVYTHSANKAVATAMATAFIGVFLPMVSTQLGGEAFVNVIWANFYGLGLWLASKVFELRTFPGSAALFAGMFIWPLLVVFGLAGILDRRGQRQSTLYFMAWMSLAFCLPMKDAVAWGLVPFPPTLAM